MINHINEHKKVHIITLEDPIEFFHPDKAASINQREMGKDSPTFKDAMRGMLRQDPDVILLGEMRDQETIQTALTAAETGHLVFSTLHTNDASQAITRIANTFPKNARSHVLNQLGDALVAVVAQQLVRRKSREGRAAAIEILRNIPAIAKQIKLGHPSEIPPIIENSVIGEKMQSMNQSLCALWVNDVISEEEAMDRSVYPDELRQLYDKHFFIERYQAEKGEQPLTQVSGWATMEMKASLPDFATKLDELEYLRELVGTTESKGETSALELEKSSEKLQEELQWVQEQLQDLRRRLEELKVKVDTEEDKWKAQITKKDAEIRQLENKISRAKRDLQN
jgi:twitching motility protein PilT